MEIPLRVQTIHSDPMGRSSCGSIASMSFLYKKDPRRASRSGVTVKGARTIDGGNDMISPEITFGDA